MAKKFSEMKMPEKKKMGEESDKDFSSDLFGEDESKEDPAEEKDEEDAEAKGDFSKELAEIPDDQLMEEVKRRGLMGKDGSSDSPPASSDMDMNQ